MDNDQLATDYEIGLKFNLTPDWDIRGGMLGTITEADTIKYFQFGVGYKF